MPTLEEFPIYEEVFTDPEAFQTILKVNKSTNSLSLYDLSHNLFWALGDSKEEYMEAVDDYIHSKAFRSIYNTVDKSEIQTLLDFIREYDTGMMYEFDKDTSQKTDPSDFISWEDHLADLGITQEEFDAIDPDDPSIWE